MADSPRSTAGSTNRPSIPFKEDDVEHKAHRDMYAKLLKFIEMRDDDEKPRILMITDVEQDYDDLCAIIFLAEMHRLGAVELVGFVANHQPAHQRAKFLRTVLNLLGLGHVPVAIGTSGVEDAKNHGGDLFYGLKNITFMDAPWNKKEFKSGAELIAEVLRSKTNVTALMTSSLQDIGEFFDRKKKTADFNKNNFAKFVSQGGYEEAKVEVTGNGGKSHETKATLIPVKGMANNEFHPTQARNYTSCLAAYNLKSDAWSREAAKAARLPGTFMQQLFQYGPIGAHLEWLWKRQEFKFYWDPYNWPFMEHLDADWYLNTRLGLDKKSNQFQELRQKRLTFAQAVPLIKTILYDGCAAVGAVGDDFMRAMGVLKPEEKLPPYNRRQQEGWDHRVFGRSPDDLGGINPTLLAKVMETFLLGGMRATCARAEAVIPRKTIKWHTQLPSKWNAATFNKRLQLSKLKNKAMKLQEAAEKAKKEGKLQEHERLLKEASDCKKQMKEFEERKVVALQRGEVPYEQLYQEAMMAVKK
ncbi:hypothetical protein C7999DRAFT_35385 [Corynascus novoguineensis]|uniref:Inosine/uridine-preferring nucleoside hydrolase domain-containing protein n=1 Tax=Corynascus novoguineensis TaxID=1126955 RepID=A0AAN7CLF6_9PEZI|nr:hypothetical protein C7999DRAFT_35385 [Corynascus novoguineensis]